MLQIHTIVTPPFAENTYVVWQPPHKQALVIDPGFQPESILEFLKENELGVAAILNTHGHLDHIAGNAAIKDAYPEAPLMIGALDEPMLTDAELNMSEPLGVPVISPPADRLLREGDIVEAGEIPLEVLEIPGHSPGHVVFLYRSEPMIVFGGDVLFRGSVGRTDFPGGSLDLLAAGIRSKLYNLPDDTVVYSGHGPTTQVGFEKRTNPFVPGLGGR